MMMMCVCVATRAFVDNNNIDNYNNNNECCVYASINIVEVLVEHIIRAAKRFVNFVLLIITSGQDSIIM